MDIYRLNLMSEYKRLRKSPEARLPKGRSPPDGVVKTQTNRSPRLVPVFFNITRRQFMIARYDDAAGCFCACSQE